MLTLPYAVSRLRERFHQASKGKPMFRPILAVAGVATILLTAACSGGGAGSGPASSVVPTSPVSTATNPPSATLSPNSFVTVKIPLFVPAADVAPQSAGRAVAAGTRRPLEIASAVQSFTVTATEQGGSAFAGSPVVVPVSASNVSCTSVAAGLTCTASVQGALGQDAWNVQTYASNNGTGSALSIGPVSGTVIQGAANVFAATLDPIVASVKFVPTSDSTSATAPATFALAFEALDANGDVILGPGLFANASNTATPVTISSSSAHLAVQTSASAAAALSLNQVSDNNIAQVAYDGTELAGSDTVTATVPGGITGTFTLTKTSGSIAVSPATVALGADLGTTTTTFSISEPGYPGTFTLSSSNCAGVVSYPASEAGPSATATVTQVGGGTCSILVQDDHGGSGSVTVKSTTILFSLQSKARAN
jgi:hypothetical protein